MSNRPQLFEEFKQTTIDKLYQIANTPPSKDIEPVMASLLDEIREYSCPKLRRTLELESEVALYAHYTGKLKETGYLITPGSNRPNLRITA